MMMGRERQMRMSKRVRGAHDDVVYVYKLSTGKMQLQKLNEIEYKKMNFRTPWKG